MVEAGEVCHLHPPVQVAMEVGVARRGIVGTRRESAMRVLVLER